MITTTMLRTMAGVAVLVLAATDTRAQMQEDPIEILRRVVTLMKQVDDTLSRTSTANSKERIEEIIEELEKLEQPPPPGGAAGAGGGGGGAAGGGAEGGAAGGGGSDGGAEGGIDQTADEIQKLLDQISGRAQSAADQIQQVLDMRGPGSGEGEGGQGSGGGGQKEGEQPPPDGGRETSKEKPESIKEPPSKGAQGDQPKPQDPKDQSPEESKTDDPPDPDSDAWVTGLPPRARDSVEMGVLDKVPPEYRGLLEKYYRVLADRERRRPARAEDREATPAPAPAEGR